MAIPGTRFGLGRLDGSPGFQPAVNPRTRTLYVPIQCRNPSTNATCDATASHVLDVISTARCKAGTGSGCRVVARAKVGAGAFLAVVDPRTDTVYVANAIANTVSVVDGARCNARITSGCGRPLATFKVGKLPSAAALNPRTHTLYVANYLGGSVSVINVARCTAVTTAGCGRPVRKVRDKGHPDGIDVDVATNTVYAANDGSNGNGNTVSVIDGARCDGANGTGCRRTPHTITVGSGPFWDVVDQATDTVYTENFNDGTVSVINGATCNARVTSGCGQTPNAVTTGAAAGFAVVDQAKHTLLVVNQEDGTLSEINTRTCSGTVTSGCPQRARSEQATFSAPQGYNPNALALLPQTQTAYLVNGGGESFVAAVSVRRCNATDTSGCRTEAPTVADQDFLISIDPATDTIYAGSLASPQIDVINGATCHAGHLAGCAPVAEIPMPDADANVGVIDEATHTLYASDESQSGTVAVINTATCNATHTAGCSAALPQISVGAFPNMPVMNALTHTLYVSYGDAGNRVAVINAATCNAAVQSGCGQTPAVIKVGTGTFALAVSTATDTIYGTNAGSDFNGDTMSVINGATCDSTDHSGCGHLAATAKTGLGPLGVTVDDLTHTVYVVNNANGDLPGSVSVIDAATCNATNATGCGRHARTLATGRSPLLIVEDPSTGRLYVTDNSSAEVTVLNGSRCNSIVTSGCAAAPLSLAVGSQPDGLGVSAGTGTVYVLDLFQAGAMSIIRAVGH